MFRFALLPPILRSKIGTTACSRGLFVTSLILVATGGPLKGDDGVTKSTSSTVAELNFFESRIRPVLVEVCLECHTSQGDTSGGLALDSRAGWEGGGDSGPAIIPGDPERSLLIKAIRYEEPDLRMPPSGKLTQEQIQDLTHWVASGAMDPRDGVTVPRKSAALPLDRVDQHWAYRPLAKSGISSGSAPSIIDRLVSKKLDGAGIVPNPSIDRRRLIRRLTLDLHGLLPTTMEVDHFIADTRPDAYARLVDRLLSSRRFGERFARHWLDVVRYAESLTLRGFTFPEAWRYREYCIENFHQDKPFRQFLLEQIAGDLMADRQTSSPRSEGLDLTDRQQSYVATTFLTLGNTNLEEQDKRQLEMDVIDEQLETIGRAFLGQTLGCARCHDHKFDPIPTRDYYGLAGILHESQLLKHDNVSAWIERPLPDTPVNEQFYRQWSSELERTNQRLAELNQGRMPEDKSQDLAFWKSEHKRLTELLSERPKSMGLISRDGAGDLPIHIRGSVHQLGELAPRGFLQLTMFAMGSTESTFSHSAPDRLDLAHWMVDRNHPLTSRVFVNRVWYWLMGEGIVRTVDNFGTTGDVPLHVELLDWLARSWMEHEWSVKWLVRTIVMTDVYQRTSDHRHVSAQELDPENRLWWRAERKRLSAESIRDSILQLTGELRDERCQRLFPRSLGSDYAFVSHETVRSIYLPAFRNGDADLLQAFDLADPSVVVGKRNQTTVAQQALVMMNDPWVIQRAEKLAQQMLQAKHGDPRDAAIDTQATIRAATGAIWGRLPSQREMESLEAYLASTATSDLSTDQRWSNLIHAMLAAIDYRYAE